MMQTRLDPQRQADIRRILVAEASAPTARPRPARLAVALGAVVAVAAGVVVATRADAPPAGYAGWSAVPQAAPPLTASEEELREWASVCTDLGVGGVAVAGARPTGKREVLVDRRGDFTYCVDVARGNGTPAEPLIALSGVRRDDGLNGMNATVSDRPFEAPLGGDVLVLGGGQDAPPPGLEVAQIFGLSGADVSGVDIVLANGLRVTATVRAGVWGAWWPAERGPAGGCVLEVRTAGGVRTVDPGTVRLPIG
ncbi:hypothetical protein [Actinoplanes sp. NPDC049802]|uniref:hypothetical protein n=1 Tax=Actinoplanes sp. NPDC049802 TaxID=3154742 RepID=UPI0033DA7297